MGVTLLVFAVELQKVRTKRIFSDFRERNGERFKMASTRGEDSSYEWGGDARRLA